MIFIDFLWFWFNHLVCFHVFFGTSYERVCDSGNAGQCDRM